MTKTGRVDFAWPRAAAEPDLKHEKDDQVVQRANHRKTFTVYRMSDNGR